MQNGLGWHYPHDNSLRSPVQADQPEDKGNNLPDKSEHSLRDILQSVFSLYFDPFPQTPWLINDLQHLLWGIQSSIYFTEQRDYLVSAEHLLVHDEHLDVLQISLHEGLKSLVFGDLQMTE